MSGIPQVFLETSIQIERFLYREREPVILFNLLGKRIHTSCYVYSEFRRTLLRDIEFVHSIVKDYWGTDWDSEMELTHVLGALRRARGVRSDRRFRRFFWIVEDLIERFGHDPVPVCDVLEWLDEHILVLGEEFFLIDFYEPSGRTQEVLYHCSTNCDLADEDRHLSKMTCRRGEAACSLAEFLEARKDRLSAVLAALQDAPSRSRSKSTINVLLNLLPGNDFEKIKGQKNCWPLGDTIIALQAPDNAPIYTLDRHFDVICEALGKERYVEQVLPSTCGSLDRLGEFS